MIISKEALVDLEEKYEKVKKLLEEDSKSDPENEPFLSKYAARSILISMNANLEKLLLVHGKQSSPKHNKLIGMLGMVQLLLGIVSIDTEELSVGEKHLNKCKTIISDDLSKPEVANVSLNMYNQFGILWSKRDPEKAKQFLEDAEKFYFLFKESNQAPLHPNDLFSQNLEVYDEVKGKEKFEKLHTLTLYYLAQIHGALGDALTSSIYCHNTLKRQLEAEDYDPIDWALNSATLSQFFMEKNGFKQARHHLAASSYILDQYNKDLEAITQRNEDFDAKQETFKHRSADVARCWAKYGLLLLSSSKDRLLGHTDDIETNCSAVTDLAKLTFEENSSIKNADLENLFFPVLDVRTYEEEITDQFILTLDDARKVFTNIQSWLNKAHTYYTIDALASDYIEIVQDQSQMYKNLVFFEDNVENQAKLYKRSADLLENVVKQVNPLYYMHYCRLIWFTLGQTYSEILDIKTDMLKESDTRPTPHALKKINTLVEKAINNFESFVESFKNAKKEMPKTIGEDLEKPFLQAYFRIGVLYDRFITKDKNRLLKNCEASLSAYKKVADYCQENPKASELISTELSLGKEMIQLLPLKVTKLKQDVTTSH